MLTEGRSRGRKKTVSMTSGFSGPSWPAMRVGGVPPGPGELASRLARWSFAAISRSPQDLAARNAFDSPMISITIEATGHRRGEILSISQALR